MTPGALPKMLEARIAALPRNRHGSRAAGAILRKYARSLNAERRNAKVAEANAREAALTPGKRIALRCAAEIARLFDITRHDGSTATYELTPIGGDS